MPRKRIKSTGRKPEIKEVVAMKNYSPGSSPTKGVRQSKRQRDVSFLTPKKEAPEAETNPNYPRGADNLVLFERHEFLAVRNEDGGFYVCRAAQYVYRHTRRFKIVWLSEMAAEENHYKIDYYDQIDFQSILTNLKMKRVEKDVYRLPESERARADRILNQALKAEEGDSEEDSDASEDGVDISTIHDEIPPKKIKVEKPTSPSTKTKKRVSAAASKRKRSQSPPKASPSKKPTSPKKGKSAAKEKKPKVPLLSQVTLYKKDPTFETNAEIPVVSVAFYSKLLIRAVLTKDTRLLQSLINDTANVASVTMFRSVDQHYDALAYAIMTENHKAIELLVKAKENTTGKARVQLPASLLEVRTTGKNSFKFLGHAVREVALSRGSREGNNALVKDPSETLNDYDYIKLGLKHGVSKKTLEVFFAACSKEEQQNLSQVPINNVVCAVRHGHHTLAGHFVDEGVRLDGFGFNSLHKEVLTFKDQDLPPYRAASVKKCAYSHKITPIHFAAINPNPKYLSTLLSIEPDYQIPDSNKRRPVHYAAACSGTGPLNFLLSRGVRTDDVDNSGFTALHVAAETGRVHNVELLLKHAEKAGTGGLLPGKDFGLGGMNQPSKETYTALHLACINGHKDVVRTLLEYGADHEKKTGAKLNNVTPLMTACQHGHQDIVHLLVQNGAKVGKDKFKRAPLTHAVINGHAHIVSHLLQLGGDPNTVDSSENSLVHYAAAYGWWFCLKLLLEAGAKPNTTNNWMMTPLGVAFLKGHLGLVDLLLELPEVDINFRNEKGATLLMMAVCSPFSPSLVTQVQHLLKGGKADFNVCDSEGNNAFHWLAANEWPSEDDDQTDSAENLETTKAGIDLANILLFNGCNPAARNNQGKTALTIAIEQNNKELVTLLLENKVEVSDDVDDKDENVLHKLVHHASDSVLQRMWDITNAKDNKSKARNSNSQSASPRALWSKMAQTYNHDGFTPLLLACKKYAEPTSKKQKKTREQLHNILKFLLEETDCDVNAVLKDKKDKTNDDDDKRDIDKFSALHFFAKCTNDLSEKVFVEQTVHLHLKCKPRLELCDRFGRTPLLLAVEHNENIARLLICAGANVNVRSGKDDDKEATALHFAARFGRTSLVQLLAERKADVNATDKDGNTALHCLKYQQLRLDPDGLDIVQRLVQCGVRVNAANKEGFTPLHLAVNSCTGSTNESVEVEHHLIKCGADVTAKDNLGRIPLHYAFTKLGICRPGKMDPLELVRILTSAMDGKQLSAVDTYGRTPLHYAAYCGATMSCMNLIKRMSFIDGKDKLGNTALSFAIMGEHESCIIVLLQQEASVLGDVTVPENEGTSTKRLAPWQWSVVAKPHVQPTASILHETARLDWQGVMYMMLDQLQTKTRDYFPAVEAALCTGKFRLALSLVLEVSDSGKVRTCNGKDQNLLHVLAMQSRPGDQTSLQLRVAESLLKHRLSLMKKDCYGTCPLVYAAMNSHAELCKLFADRIGGDNVINHPSDKLGRTPLNAVFWSVEDNDWEEDSSNSIRTWCTEYLQGSALNGRAKYPTPKPNPGQVVTAKREDANSTTSREWLVTPLIHAICSQSKPLMAFLLRSDADVNVADNYGCTPLMHAVRLNDAHAVKTLLNCPSDSRKKKAAKETNEEEEAPAGVLTFRNALVLRRQTSIVPARPRGTQANNDAAGGQLYTFGWYNSGWPMAFKTNAAQKDNEGRTALHYAVQPYPGMSYGNVGLAQLLAEYGVPVGEPDRRGVTPLQLAVDGRFANLALALKQLNKSGGSFKINIPPVPETVFDDGVAKMRQSNYREDAEAYIELSRMDSEEFDTSEESVAVTPDRRSNMTDNGMVVVDPKSGLPFDIFMRKIDIVYGVNGRFSFYKMQVIQHKGKPLFVLFTCWGMLGCDGQFQLTPFNNLDDAVKEFCSIFRAKSGNSWDDVKTFQTLPKKYHLVSHEERRRVKHAEVAIGMTGKVPSKLPKPLHDLMTVLTNVHVLKKACGDAGLDEDMLPFGRLTEATVAKAQAILSKLRDLVTEKEKIQSDAAASKDKFGEMFEKIVVLSNQFYQVMPMACSQYYAIANSSGSYERVAPLDCSSTVEQVERKLLHLAELGVTSQLLQASQYHLIDTNPLDYVYGAMKCKVAMMSEADAESQLILQYIHNTSDGLSPTVTGIYRVQREAERTAQRRNLGNRWWLWHGTSDSNLISIFTRGLKCGYLDHAGYIYQTHKPALWFADMFRKSHDFVSTSEGNENKYIFLCEVALGKLREVTSLQELPEEEFDSVKVPGDKAFPNPVYNTIMSSGVTVPLGGKVRPKKRKDDEYSWQRFNYNEYVVFDESQVSLRYVVHYRMGGDGGGSVVASDTGSEEAAASEAKESEEAASENPASDT